jgi:hypothetical protein
MGQSLSDVREAIFRQELLAFGIFILRVPDCLREDNTDRPVKRMDRKSEGVKKDMSPLRRFGISSRPERQKEADHNISRRACSLDRFTRAKTLSSG